MVHMVHIAIKRRLALIILVFITTNLFAQQQTEPEFTYKDPNNKHLSNLNYFLDNYKPVPLNDCLYASGTFKFKVLKNGRLSKIYTSGNLPDTLVSNIKKRIFETEGHWLFSSKKDSIKSLKWFVLPVYIQRKMTSDCTSNGTIEESFNMTIKLFDKKSKIVETPTSYLIYPLYIFGIN